MALRGNLAGLLTADCFLGCIHNSLSLIFTSAREDVGKVQWICSVECLLVGTKDISLATHWLPLRLEPFEAGTLTKAIWYSTDRGCGHYLCGTELFTVEQQLRSYSRRSAVEEERWRKTYTSIYGSRVLLSDPLELEIHCETTHSQTFANTVHWETWDLWAIILHCWISVRAKECLKDNISETAHIITATIDCIICESTARAIALTWTWKAKGDVHWQLNILEKNTEEAWWKACVLLTTLNGEELRNVKPLQGMFFPNMVRTDAHSMKNFLSWRPSR